MRKKINLMVGKILNVRKDILILVFVAFAVGLSAIPHFLNRETIVINITKKERVMSSTSDGQINSKYLVFSENETFENSDSLLEFKFNSSDVYGQIKQGKRYKVLVYGLRLPFFSTYRNIKTIQEIK